jgi:hypothetical protein
MFLVQLFFVQNLLNAFLLLFPDIFFGPLVTITVAPIIIIIIIIVLLF